MESLGAENPWNAETVSTGTARISKFKTDREIAHTGETAQVGAVCSAADVPKFDMDSEAGFVL